jgi:hypothetical protein
MHKAMSSNPSTANTRTQTKKERKERKEGRQGGREEGRKKFARHWSLMPVILAIWEAEIRRIVVRSQPR